MNRKFLNNCITSLIIAVIILSPSMVVRSQSGEPPAPQGFGPDAIYLQPESAAELVLGSMWAERKPDGLIHLQVDGGSIKGVPFLAYDLTVDFDNGTYYTVLVPLSEIDSPSIPGNMIDSPAFNDENQFLSPTSSSIEPMAIKPGTYEAEIWVETRDPQPIPNYLLARTKNYLKWSVSSGGNVSWLAKSDACIPYTTPIGTVWEIASCPQDPVYSVSGGVVNETTAAYENANFLDPNQYTYTWHWIKVGGYNDGSCFYQWDWKAWGEASSLLNGQRIVVKCPSGL